MESRELEILGFNHQPLQNILHSSGNSNSHLAVVLPGLGYLVTYPALLYPNMLLRQFGADTLHIDPTYRTSTFGDLTDLQKAACIAADAQAIGQAIQKLEQYQRLTFIGKSIATRILAAILEHAAFANAEYIWLTPLFKDQVVFRAATAPHKGFFAIGSSDGHYDVELLEQVKTVGEVLVFEGAGHSLEVFDDVLASIEIQAKLARHLLGFLTK